MINDFVSKPTDMLNAYICI